MLSCVEHEKSFITTGPCQTLQNATYPAVSRHNKMNISNTCGNISGPMLLNVFMLNSAEHNIFSANKYENANNSCF